MMREQCSMRVTLEGCTAPLMVGPMVAESFDGGGSSYEVLTPGIPYSPSAVNQWGQMQSSNHNRCVVNEATGDLLHLHREGKNSASVLKNVQCCVNGKGKLEPMTLRGTGGALCLAGQNMMNSHSRGSTREAPTHIVLPGQKWTTLSRVMDDCCLQERVMNVFYQGIYIGPFFASETAQKRLTSTEAAREARNITAALGALHLSDSVAFPSGTPRSGTDHEMASMKVISRFFTLTPLDVDFVESYGKLANKSLVNVGPEDFVIPMHIVPKDEVNEQFGEKFVDVHSLIQEAEGLSFLTDAAIERELPHTVGEVHGGTVYDARGARLNAGQLESTIFHAAGVTVAKTGCKGVVRHSDGCMSPPRAILWDNGIGTEEGRVAEYARELEQRNLKPVMMKAVHPCHLGHEPAAWLAMVSTGSCDPELREREEVGGQWVPTRRHGTNFVLQERTRAEATQIMFQAALCAMTCPATLVNVDLALRQRGLLHEDSPPTMPPGPRPGTAHYHAFMAMQRTHDIGNAIVHPTFKMKIGREAYIELVSGLERSGGNIFVRAVEEARVGGRNAAVKALLADLNELLDGDEVVLSEFHVQVIMRTIEMCLHEPFGPVTAVPMGSGSKGAAMCFRETWNGHATTSARTEEFHLVTEVDAVVASSSMPARIVVHLNEWVRKALKGREDATRTRMQKVLRVLDLEWSDDAECLVHALGIGKRFDVSDAEHTLCLIFTLHQATLPLRTISKGYEVDSTKVFPIRVNVGEVAARELSCMAKFLDGWEGRLTAYQDLLKDVDFDHQSLPDIFRIDSTSPEEVGDTARGGGGGAGGGGNAVRREEVGCASRDEIPNAGSRAFPRVEGDPEDANGVEAGAVRRGDDDNDDNNDDDSIPRVPVRFPAWRYGAGNRHERAFNAPNDESGPADVDEEMADAVVGGAGVWTHNAPKAKEGTCSHQGQKQVEDAIGSIARHVLHPRRSLAARWRAMLPTSKKQPEMGELDCQNIEPIEPVFVGQLNSSDTPYFVSFPWWDSRINKTNFKARKPIWTHQTVRDVQAIINASSINDVFIDIGANLKFVKVLLPISNEAGLLMPIIYVCIMYHAAAGSFGNEMVNITRPSDSLGHFDAAPLSREALSQKDLVTECIPLVTVDSLVPNDVSVGVVKIDVQGHEYGVLKGMTNLLSRNDGFPKYVFYEDDEQLTRLAGNNPGDCERLLVGFGYMHRGSRGG
ncbi:LOW QUALITY PROTEIN: hypothetical protein ACHAXT_004801 [Thalassiosira profunda]